MEIIKEKNSRSGVIGTVVVHLLLLLLFISAGMPYQDPPPENEGAMMINFGTTDTGSGDETPTEPASSASENVTPNESSAAEDVLTQNNAEAPVVNSSPTQEQTDLKPAEEKPVVSENLSNAMDALTNSEKAKSEGEKEGEGDQGDVNGDPNSKGTSTVGGSGIGFDLGGRGKMSFKKPENPTQEDGKVVVEIWVNRDGKVLKAKTGARGSTTTNPILQQKAKEAALKAKFKRDENAPFEQKGTKTFVFILN